MKIQMKTAFEILVAAKELIRDPKHWTQKTFVRLGPEPAICASEAIRVASGDESQVYVHDPAYNFLCEAMGVEAMAVCRFNDDHTHKEVLDAFDDAIELARKAL